jgi:site-specific DNA-cytosine methylase
MRNPDKEIKRGMGFPPNYRMLGSQCDQTRQLGHSLSPGTLTEIVRRAIAML